MRGTDSGRKTEKGITELFLMDRTPQMSQITFCLSLMQHIGALYGGFGPPAYRTEL